ncbi:MAG: hydratase, partial [Clostridiales bacterium]|nr:hydratase [Clostridiales bacterium]
MIRWTNAPMALSGGRLAPAAEVHGASRDRTMAAAILAAHGPAAGGRLRVTFDALASHDITYVGIVQTARASGMARFPLPYALTNCHNSLCAVGGTINEDDHAFGLSAAVKYGGIYVPAHQAVIHQYVREVMARPGGMILGSDSHTRYGALGCMGVGEGGPELVKQLLGQTWDLAAPEVVAVRLTGAPRRGVGPQDVALALIARVFADGLVKNKVLEFIGPGVAGLSVEYRMGIDVMTTETACLSSIWPTDDRVHEYLALHGRADDYAAIAPGEGALYDGAIEIDLSEIRPMIALPFHPSNALPIDDFLADPLPRIDEIETRAARLMKKGAPPKLSAKVRGGDVYVDQAVIAGCSGGLFENITDAADMLLGRQTGGGDFSLSVYPSSQPLMMA